MEGKTSEFFPFKQKAPKGCPLLPVLLFVFKLMRYYLHSDSIGERCRIVSADLLPSEWLNILNPKQLDSRTTTDTQKLLTSHRCCKALRGTSAFKAFRLYYSHRATKVWFLWLFIDEKKRKILGKMKLKK